MIYEFDTIINLTHKQLMFNPISNRRDEAKIQDSLKKLM